MPVQDETYPAHPSQRLPAHYEHGRMIHQSFSFIKDRRRFSFSIQNVALQEKAMRLIAKGFGKLILSSFSRWRCLCLTKARQHLCMNQTRIRKGKSFSWWREGTGLGLVWLHVNCVTVANVYAFMTNCCVVSCDKGIAMLGYVESIKILLKVVTIFEGLESSLRASRAPAYLWNPRLIDDFNST